jgi:hypothetical protein
MPVDDATSVMTGPVVSTMAAVVKVWSVDVEVLPAASVAVILK